MSALRIVSPGASAGLAAAGEPLGAGLAGEAGAVASWADGDVGVADQVIDIVLEFGTAHLEFLDFLCLLAIGCLLAFLFLRRLGTASLFPARDPRLAESLKLSN